MIETTLIQKKGPNQNAAPDQKEGADKARQSLPSGRVDFAYIVSQLTGKTAETGAEPGKTGLPSELTAELSGAQKDTLAQMMDELAQGEGQTAQDNLQDILSQMAQTFSSGGEQALTQAFDGLDVPQDVKDALQSLQQSLADVMQPLSGAASAQGVDQQGSDSKDSETLAEALRQLQRDLAEFNQKASSALQASSAQANGADDAADGEASFVEQINQALSRAMAHIEQLQKANQSTAGAEASHADSDKITALETLSQQLTQLKEVLSQASNGKTDTSVTSVSPKEAESSEQSTGSLQSLLQKLLSGSSGSQGADASSKPSARVETAPDSAQTATQTPAQAKPGVAGDLEGIQMPKGMAADQAATVSAEARTQMRMDARETRGEPTRWAEAKNELKQELKAEMTQTGGNAQSQAGGQGAQQQAAFQQQMMQQQWQQSQQQKHWAQQQQQATKAASEAGLNEDKKSERVEKLLGSLGLESRGGLPPALQTLSQPSRSPNWSQALSQRVLYMASHKMQEAKITLNPEKLGSIQVKLNIDKDQVVHVSMQTQQGTTREAIEQAMPKLKEMLESAGMAFGSLDVSDQRRDTNASSQQQAQSQSGGFGAQDRDEDTETVPEPVALNTGLSQNLVDYYA